MPEYIWYEKHRPKTLQEMTLPPQYRRNFSEYIASGEVPHLLLFGPQGSGKTTISFILMENIPCVTLKLNASSADRGIETMRGKVKQFASSIAMAGKLKIVFLDEGDGITRDAQEALRGTIEAYSKNCRFIITCNEIDRIIPPIKSRCTMFEFSTFPFQQVLRKSEAILKTEGIGYAAEDVEKVVQQYYPDIRSVVNNLQLCSISGKLDPNAIAKITVDVNTVIDLLVQGEVWKIRSAVAGLTTFLYLYRGLFDTLLGSDELKPDEKISIAHALAEGLYRDSLVANREINFIDCCLTLMGILECKTISFNP